MRVAREKHVTRMYVDGLKPGDAAAVTVRDIRIVGTGYMGVRAGQLNGRVKEDLRLYFTPERDVIRFNALELPINPMVGVIGLAPREGSVGNQYSGEGGV